MNGYYKSLCGIRDDMRIVVTGNGIFETEDIDSALGAIGYAAKKDLRLSESVTGSGEIYGNVMILDVYIPLDSSRSSSPESHETEFFASVRDYLTNGVYHRGAGVTLGGFGVGTTIQYFAPSPVRKLTIVLETNEDEDVITKSLSVFGTVESVK